MQRERLASARPVMPTAVHRVETCDPADAHKGLERWSPLLSCRIRKFSGVAPLSLALHQVAWRLSGEIEAPGGGSAAFDEGVHVPSGVLGGSDQDGGGTVPGLVQAGRVVVAEVTKVVAVACVDSTFLQLQVHRLGMHLRQLIKGARGRDC